MSGGRIREITALRDQVGVFADRTEAGVVLADLISQCALPQPLLLAIPAGGVPVAAAVADKLSVSFDLAVVSKITLPWNAEVGYGAVAFDDSYRLNPALIEAAGLTDEEVERGIAATRTKVARRVRTLRRNRSLPDLSAHDVVVIDDGLASGFTMLVAVDALRRAGARSIMVAVPTGHSESVRRMQESVETVCCANIRRGATYAVASAYRDWKDVSEAECEEILQRFTRSDG
jgi:predicted phosphoribosyltransferase